MQYYIMVVDKLVIHYYSSYTTTTTTTTIYYIPIVAAVEVLSYVSIDENLATRLLYSRVANNKQLSSSSIDRNMRRHFNTCILLLVLFTLLLVLLLSAFQK
jgi:hypothetical protein